MFRTYVFRLSLSSLHASAYMSLTLHILQSFGALTPAKKSKKADSSASMDDEKAQIAAFEFKAPVGKAPKAVDNKKVGPQASDKAASATEKKTAEGDKKSKKSTSKSSSVTSSDVDSDSGIFEGYPSSIPSTPQDSSDFSFTTSDYSESDSGEPDSSSVDEFANNTLEIKLDDDTVNKLQAKLKHTRTLEHEVARDLANEEDRGVIFLSHIPHGFYERQMKSFFSQFGVVTRLRLSRSKRSGRSRGYAFIEFADRDVAEIVAETMNDYLMYGRRLKSEVLAKEKVHPRMFAGSYRFKDVDDETNVAKERRRKHGLHYNRSRSQQEMDAAVKKLLEREEKRREKLAKAGIAYEFDGFAAQAPDTAVPDLAALSKSNK